MQKELIVSSNSLETKVAIIEDDLLSEIYIERTQSKGILGNIYKGRVTRVLPGMQSAFVDIGLERDAFLYVSDFFEDSDEFERIDTAPEEQAAAASPQPAAGERSERGRRSRSRWERERAPRPGPAAQEPREAPGFEPGAEPAVLPIPSASEYPTDSEVRAALEHWFAESEYESEIPAATETEDAPPPSEADEDGEEVPEASFMFSPEEPDEAAEAVEPETTGKSCLPGDADHPEIPERFNAEPGPAHPKIPAPEEERAVAEDVAPVSQHPEPEPETQKKAAEPAPENTDASIRNPGDNSSFNPRKGPNRRRSSSRRRGPAKKDSGQKFQQRQTISELLREGQEIMVQVAKEPISRKGARLTSYVALPGRFLVYMPTVEHIGVSRKIDSDAERLRLRKLVNELRGNNIPGGFIVRTAGENHTDKEIEADIKYLHNLWDDIRSGFEKAAAPALLHSELGLVERIIRDHLSDDFKAIRVDDEQEYERILDFISRYQPSMVSRIKLFTKNVDIFDEYGVNNEIRRALEPKMWLKSGGYIVINQTEALVAIDVNTGKYVGKSDSLEETITKTNLEAVKEVIRQIRLRDLGGIIVIDFIDMEERKNRHRVMDALQQEIMRDKAPSKVLEFNEFGLVAITRKRVKQSLEKVLCQPCPYCGGSGMVKSITTICYQIHSEIQKMVGQLEGGDLAVRVHPEVARALKNGEGKVLREIETMVGHEINIKPDDSLHITRFDIIV